VLIAILASFTALALARRGGAGWRERFQAAATMAGGVWAMHFIAMLGFRLPIDRVYDAYLTLLSLVPVLAGSALSFGLVRDGAVEMRSLLFGGLCLGSGIAAMHYTGMAALSLSPPIHYHPGWFALSLLVAFAASCGGLYFAFCADLRDRWRQAGAAIVMGFAISGTHYVGMAAADFDPDTVPLAEAWVFHGQALPGLMAGAVLLLFLALFFSLAETVHSVWLSLALIVGGETAITALLDGLSAKGPFSAPGLRSLNGLLLGLFLLPIFLRLRRESQRLAQARQALRFGFDHQSALNALLSFPLDRYSTDDLLSKGLDIVLSIPWLGLLPRGGIFLLDEARGTLALKVSRNLDPAVELACGQAEIGRCLCGRAVACGELLFVDGVEARHAICREGMADHGHYCVPIGAGGDTIGLLVLYVAAGHKYSEHEASFLKAVGGTLGGLLRRKQMEDQLRLSDVVFRHAGEGILVADAERRIMRVNRAFETITGYKESEVRGRDPSILNSGRQDEAFYQAMWRSLNERGEWQGEIWNRNKAGDVYPEWLSIRAVHDEQGKLAHYVGIFTDISAFKQAQEHIEHLAYNDHLTGLANRGAFLNKLAAALRSARRSGQGLAVIFLDLDRFKSINDSLGHDAGDQVLLETAERLSACVREGDTVARLGGDEFVVCLSQTGQDSAQAVAAVNAISAKLCRQFVEPFHLKGRDIVVGPSIGIALYPWDGETPEDLIKNADTAMYHAKKQGGAEQRFYKPEMSAASLAQLEMQSDLRKALERDEFELHYQPRVDIFTGRIVGAEALLRWRHPRQGWLLPERFLAVAEESNLSVALGAWVLRAACIQRRLWQAHGPPLDSPVPISVNISPRQFHHPDFPDQLAALLGEFGLAADWLEIEVTEAALMQRSEIVVAILNRLKALGVRILVDDFGVGYSSLGYLKRFPVDALKIDRSFVKEVATAPNDAAIVRAAAAMAGSLNLKVIAEGVESEAQVAFLREIGCGEYQGFLFSGAVCADEFIAMVAGGGGSR
jgi:diguanylate cyclase (GGDEF)-like protein/PAS domain S-box-containing protein